MRARLGKNRKGTAIPTLAIGIASVFYWQRTEAQGVGDLRLYALVQFLLMLIIPIIGVGYIIFGLIFISHYRNSGSVCADFMQQPLAKTRACFFEVEVCLEAHPKTL